MSEGRSKVEKSPWEELKEQVVLGSDAFLKELRGDVRGNAREQRGASRLAKARPRLGEVIAAVEKILASIAAGHRHLVADLAETNYVSSTGLRILNAIENRLFEKRADVLLIDERRGRRVAQREGVPVIGLLGLVVEAKRRGLIPSLREMVNELEQEAGFRISGALKARVLAEAGE